MKRIALLVLTFTLGFGFAADAVAKGYAIEVFNYSFIPKALNNNGDIAGYNRFSSYYDLQIRSDGKWYNVPASTGTMGKTLDVFAMNDRNDVLLKTKSGLYVVYDGRAYRLTDNEFPSYGDINEKGTVVSSYYPRTAFQTYAGSLKRDLVQNEWGYAQAINDSGIIVGTTKGVKGNYAAAVLSLDGMLRLETPGNKNSQANDINNSGVIVGYYDRDAVIWGVDGKMSYITNNSTVYSRAVAINDAGQVVGKNQDGIFLWDELGGLVALSSLVSGETELAKLLGVVSFNNSGQILGYGETQWGETLYFLATPTPIPGAVWLLGTGLLGLVGLRRRGRVQ